MGRLNRGIVTLLAVASLTLARSVVAQTPYADGPPVRPVPEMVMPADIPIDGLEEYDAYGPEEGGPEEGWPEEGWPVDAMDMDYYHAPAHADCNVCAPDPCSCHGIWTVEGEALVLHRVSSRNTLLSFEFNNVPQQVDRLTTKDFKFSIAAGLRLAGRRYLGSDLQQRDYNFEVIYFGPFEWNEKRQVSGNREADGNIAGLTRGSLLSQFVLTGLPQFILAGRPLGAFDGADIHRSSYRSKLNNVEWNLRIGAPLRRERRVFTPGRGWTVQRGIGCSHTMFGGLRYMTVHEDFEFSSTTRLDLNNAFLGNTSGIYRVKTRNRLLGVQIGGELSQRETRWEWGLRGKIGAFVNMGQQLSGIVFDDAAEPNIFMQTPGEFVNDSEERAAIVGEASIFGVFRLRPGLALRAGYHLLWAGGVALAPEQLVFSFREPIVIQQRGTLFYQGASLGLEASW